MLQGHARYRNFLLIFKLIIFQHISAVTNKTAIYIVSQKFN